MPQSEARIIHGDCRYVLPTLSRMFDCAICDPPYGETSLAWDRWPDGWPALVLPVLKTSGSMWVFGSFRMFMDRWSEFSGWRYVQEVVWEKHNGTNMANDRFRRVHELAVQFVPATSLWGDVFKEPQFTNDATARTVRHKRRPAQWGDIGPAPFYKSEDGGPRLARSVLQVRSEHSRAIHPTQKPIGIVEPLIRFSCPLGGHIIDPFSGSGTVGVIAKRLGMDATLIEAKLEFAASSTRRIEDDAPLFAEVSA